MIKGKKPIVIIIAVAVIILAIVVIIIIRNNGSKSDPSSSSTPTTSDSASDITVNIEPDAKRDIDQTENIQVFQVGRLNQFEVNFKSVACYNLPTYISGVADQRATSAELTRLAEAFKQARDDISSSTNLPQIAPMIRGDRLAENILNQANDIYGNFWLVANYSHYVEQQDALNVFSDQELAFIKRAQHVAYALGYVNSSSSQPRPDIAYGMRVEGTSASEQSSVLMTTIGVDAIIENLDKYQICSFDYSYTNTADEGANSGDFNDICRSGTLGRPVPFNFVMPSIDSTAYVNETVNHPQSWPIGYESLTEDCDGSHIGSGETHNRNVKFLMPADIEVETTDININIGDQTIELTAPQTN